MRFFYSTLVCSLCAAFCRAQAATDDATFVKQARAKYDAPFERNLQSFSCAIEFNWKQHFTEAVRVGDEGTDDEIAELNITFRCRDQRGCIDGGVPSSRVRDCRGTSIIRTEKTESTPSRNLRRATHRKDFPICTPVHSIRSSYERGVNGSLHGLFEGAP